MDEQCEWTLPAKRVPCLQAKLFPQAQPCASTGRNLAAAHTALSANLTTLEPVVEEVQVILGLVPTRSEVGMQMAAVETIVLEQIPATATQTIAHQEAQTTTAMIGAARTVTLADPAASFEEPVVRETTVEAVAPITARTAITLPRPAAAVIPIAKTTAPAQPRPLLQTTMVAPPGLTTAARLVTIAVAVTIVAVVLPPTIAEAQATTGQTTVTTARVAAAQPTTGEPPAVAVGQALTTVV